MRKTITVAYALLLTSLTACAATLNNMDGMQTVEATVLHSSSQCNYQEEETRATWLNNLTQYQKAFKQIHSAQIKPAAPPLPDVNFAAEGVLFIEMGRKPTAGYQLLFNDQQITVKDGVATVNIEWRAPPPGQMTAQVITSPCMLLRLPKDDINTIEIRDQDGELRAAIDITMDDVSKDK